MKNKKSLLSVLLAAVLLCACVAGMLIFGASAEGEEVYAISVGSSETNQNVSSALAAIDPAALSGNDRIEITLTSDVEETNSNTLFSAETIALPITIKGGYKITANVLSAGPITSVNDITLNGVTLVTNATQLNLGNRKVVLDGVTIPVDILLNSGETVSADSSLTIQGDTAITGNVILVAGETVVAQEATTSLIYSGGNVNGIVCGATDTATINGEMVMNVTTTGTANRLFGLAGNATVNGKFDFDADKITVVDYLVGIYGLEFDGATASCPTLNGEMNFTVKDVLITQLDDSGTSSTSNARTQDDIYGLKALYANGNLTANSKFTVTMNGTTAGLRPKYTSSGSTKNAGIGYGYDNNLFLIHLNDFTDVEKTRISSEIAFDLVDFKVTYMVFSCLRFETAGVLADNSAKIVTDNPTISCSVSGTSSFGSNFSVVAGNSTDVKITATVNCDITEGTFNSSLRFLYDVALTGDATLKIYTTKTWDDDTNDGEHAIFVHGQICTNWSGTVANSYIYINGGENKSVTVNGGDSATSTDLNVSEGGVNVTASIRNLHDNSCVRVAGCRGDAMTGLIDMFVENCQIECYYGGGTPINVTTQVNEVKNTLKNVTVSGAYYGGAGTKTGSSSVSVVNDIQTGCQITGRFCAGNVRGDLTTGTTTTIASGTTFSNTVTFNNYLETEKYTGITRTIIINGGTFNKSVTGGDVTINGGTFKGVVNGDNVALNGNVSILEGGQINADTVGANVTVTKNDAWGTFDTVYVTAPADAAQKITVVNGDGVTGLPVIMNKGYQLRGMIDAQAKLFVDTRTMLRLYFNKAQIEQYLAVEESITCLVNMENVGDLATGTLDLNDFEAIGETEYCYIDLDAVGAGSFGNDITASFNSVPVQETTILQICQNGIGVYTGVEGDLFKALYDYGLTAINKDATLQYDGIEIDESDVESLTGKFSKPETTPVAFNGVTLLMGDAIGIRFKFTPDANLDKNLFKVIIAGEDLVQQGKCVIDVAAGTLDFFVNAESLAKGLAVEISYGEGESAALCMSMNGVSVKSIAMALSSANARVKATQNFIQATQNYLAAQAA